MDKKYLIKLHNTICEEIAQLRESISNCVILEGDEKAKINFGNKCIALKGFTMATDAIEAMLMNEGCIKGDDGNFYDKVIFDESKYSNCQNISESGTDN